MSAIQALEQWCRCECEGYRDVSITNMTTSFRSGLAFCALIHRHRPDLIDYDSLRMEDVFDNNKLAFQVAEEKLGIPALLDAEDMVALRIPDRLSILTYVSQYYNYFKGRTPMGRVKRPAEGSKEAPSEKKNLPVAIKASLSKTAIKNQAPPAVIATRTSPKLAKPAAQRPENSNKNGTLNSKCAACKSHVHLVQRHFAEGKLFHRSCFTCCECSGSLHAGGYKPGKDPGTFVCKVHQEKSTKTSFESRIKTRPGMLNLSVQLEPQPSSLPKPVHAAPPTHCWTASAQKTQAARQNFFLEASIANCRKSTEPWGGLTFPQRPDVDWGRDGKKLSEENNNNNNNKHLFSVCSAERRKNPAANVLSTSSQESACPTAVKCDNITHPTTADGPLCDTQIKPKWMQIEPEPRDNDSTDREHRFVSTSFSGIPSSATRPPTSAPRPPPVTFALARYGRPADPPRRHSPVKSPARWPALEYTSSPTSPANIPSGAKKGKYLSPTDASRTEMRSPSHESYHIPAEQIESELSDIEANVARLEREGVELEKKLRRCEEEGEGDVLMDPLMADWFKLIQKKQMFIRRESELVYTAKTQDLEQRQLRVEQELRTLLEKPDHVKTTEERAWEKTLMRRLMELVDGRNAIVEVLDDDRLSQRATSWFMEEDKMIGLYHLSTLGFKKRRYSSLPKVLLRPSIRSRTPPVVVFATDGCAHTSERKARCCQATEVQACVQALPTWLFSLVRVWVALWRGFYSFQTCIALRIPPASAAPQLFNSDGKTATWDSLSLGTPRSNMQSSDDSGSTEAYLSACTADCLRSSRSQTPAAGWSRPPTPRTTH
ncbi:MICAL-like protein 2a [Dunckerocampus dactyliophorus]|uniref:MICAL-like protein 2a n=1 Tax=Dunckerocampus dactyliophorus TaxID=161453 RepID=UPI0024072DF0|nr:MICAL-like protein 2a [Dunckerocampus dactyliophorus]